MECEERPEWWKDSYGTPHPICSFKSDSKRGYSARGCEWVKKELPRPELEDGGSLCFSRNDGKENIRYFVCDQNNCNGAEMDFGSACDISATGDDYHEYFARLILYSLSSALFWRRFIPIA